MSNTGHPPLPDDLVIPVGPDDEPVFSEPWEARIFSMVVKSHRDGLFQWQQFQGLLVDEIRKSEDANNPRSYYVNWALAAERLFESLSCTNREDIDARVRKLRPEDKTVHLR